MTRYIPHLAWALVVLGALAAGRFSHARSNSALRGARGLAGGRENLADAALNTVDELGKGHARASAFTREEAADLTRKVFSQDTAAGGCRLACELIPGITLENWHDVLEAIAPEKERNSWSFKTTAAYHLILQRIGAVAGAKALEEQLGQKKIDEDAIGYLMRGWSEKNPQGTTDWFTQLPPDNQQKLVAELISGVAHNDPSKALGLIAMDKDFQNDEASGNIMRETIQAGGFRAAEDLVGTLKDRAELPWPIKGKVFSTLASREVELNTTAGTPLAGLNWMEQFVGNNVLGPNSTGALVRQAAVADPQKTLAWLQQHGDQLTANQQKAAYPAFAGTWQAQAPDQFAAWLTANPVDPKHDPFAAAAAQQQLNAGNFQDAQRWLQMVSDPATRAQLNDALRARQARAAAQPRQ